MTRKSLTPRTARTNDQLCALRRDNVTSGDYWTIIDEDTISLAAQKVGEHSTGIVRLPRAVFERFVRWYDTGSMR